MYIYGVGKTPDVVSKVPPGKIVASGKYIFADDPAGLPHPQQRGSGNNFRIFKAFYMGAEKITIPPCLFPSFNAGIGHTELIQYICVVYMPQVAVPRRAAVAEMSYKVAQTQVKAMVA